MFTINETGCFIDGVRGYYAQRRAMADIVEYWHSRKVCGRLHTDQDIALLKTSLYGPMPDDDWDMDEAMDILNSGCSWEVIFEWVDGDLMLNPSADYVEISETADPDIYQ